MFEKREKDVPVIVAIDGPAGAGKSEVARWLTKQMGAELLNSGEFYRAITYWCIIQGGKSLESQDSLIECARSCRFSLSKGVLSLQGKALSRELLHSTEVDKMVAQLSAIVEIRHLVNQRFRELAARQSLVAEGRDMTTVVFPDANVKIFLDASPLVRAQRRSKERGGGRALEEILDETNRRDSIDRNKKEGALIRASEAFYLDTSDLTFEEVCVRVLEHVKERCNLGRISG